MSSFSWRNKQRPAFLLASFVKDGFDISKCYLPDENYVINVYIGSIVLFIISFKIF